MYSEQDTSWCLGQECTKTQGSHTTGGACVQGSLCLLAPVLLFQLMPARQLLRLRPLRIIRQWTTEDEKYDFVQDHYDDDCNRVICN